MSAIVWFWVCVFFFFVVQILSFSFDAAIFHFLSVCGPGKFFFLFMLPLPEIGRKSCLRMYCSISKFTDCA